jgi:histidine triad (HIT) family protein
MAGQPQIGLDRSMAETIFSKIIAGEIPCHKVYEDDDVLAFLDVGPLAEGHTLVIPKQQVATLDELSDDAAAAIGRVLPRLCRAVMAATGAKDYNILQNNGAAAHQAVFHVHFHIIPKGGTGPGLDIGWNPIDLAPARAAELAAKISAEI